MTEAPRRISILIVDDEASIRRLLTAALEDEGYGVRIAGDGESALLATRDVLPDLVILDLGLPRLTGEAYLRQVRTDGLDLPVLVVSARLDGAAVANAAGATAYLSKPFDLWALLDKVAELTGGTFAPGC